MKSGRTLAVLSAVGLVAFMCFGFINVTTHRDGAGAHVSCAGFGASCTVRFSREVDRPPALVQGAEVRLKSVGPDFVEIGAARLRGLLWTTTTRVSVDGPGVSGGYWSPYRMEVVDFTADHVTVEMMMDPAPRRPVAASRCGGLSSERLRLGPRALARELTSIMTSACATRGGGAP
jgi:hypothetical protein